MMQANPTMKCHLPNVTQLNYKALLDDDVNKPI